MRLKNSENPLSFQFPRRFNQRRYFCRMVGIIGDNPDSIPIHNSFKSPAKGFDIPACRNKLPILSPLTGNRYSRRSIPLIMAARQRNRKRLVRQGKRFAFRISRAESTAHRIVGPVKHFFSSLANELFKTIDKSFSGCMVFHVVVFNIRYNRIIRRVSCNRPVGFIGLHHHQGSIAGDRLNPGYFPANAISAIKQLRDHGRRRCLSMCAADRYTGSITHKRRKHLPAPGDGNTHRRCPLHLRMGVRHSSRSDQPADPVIEMHRCMPRIHLDSVIRQPAGLPVFLQITTTDLPSTFFEQPGQTRHTDSADAYKMSMPSLTDQLFGLVYRRHGLKPLPPVQADRPTDPPRYSGPTFSWLQPFSGAGPAFR
ncbi:MAG TPA: hypothetical protein VIR77_05695 [Pontiella sp.]